LSKNETYRSIFINEDGKNKVLLFNNKTNRPIDFPDIPDGSVSDVIISDSENKFLITVSSSTSSPNLYVYDITTKKLIKITSTQNNKINENDLVQAQIIHFKSFDGLQIPAIYYKPLLANKNNKVPAIVSVHGGPGGQSRIGFSPSIQYLVNHGYAVLAVNNRGSSGYGKTFFKLDDKDHGNGDLKDCIWAKKWLSEQNYIDKEAIGIDGGSYGGNMVLNALCLYPEEFKVGVNRYGVSNWIRTLKNFPAFNDKNAFFAEMGNPYTNDSINLKKISPIYHYQKITKPLLVFQGANDVRVLQIESDEIVEGLKKNKIPVEYVVFPDEGHGFQKTENQIITDERTLKFLDKYLKPKRIK
jgi:dipeptidyl aminopeptidase/acylaminoacyl peptidase